MISDNLSVFIILMIVTDTDHIYLPSLPLPSPSSSRKRCSLNNHNHIIFGIRVLFVCIRVYEQSLFFFTLAAQLVGV